MDRWRRRVLGGGTASAKALKLEEAEACVAGIEVRLRGGAGARSYRDHEARISGLSLIPLGAEFSRSHLPASQVSHLLQQ